MPPDEVGERQEAGGANRPGQDQRRLGSAVRLAFDTQVGRQNHEILMAPGADILAIEGVGNVGEIRNKVFYVFAFPFSVTGVDSTWTRVVAVDER